LITVIGLVNARKVLAKRQTVFKRKKQPVKPPPRSGFFRFCAKRRTKKAGFPQIATNQQCLIFFKLFRWFNGTRLPLG